MTISITQLNAITHVLVLKKLTNNVYNTNPLLKRLYENKVLLDGGTKIGAPVISGASDSTTGGFYTGMANLDSSEKDDITRAEVNWKQFHETVLISRADILKNSGSMQQLNLVKSKITVAEMRAKAKLALGLYSDGTDTEKFNGLQEIINLTGAYAGLAVSDILDEAGANAWIPVIKSNSGTSRSLSLSLVQQAMGATAYDEDRVSLAVSKQNVFDELWNLLSPHQRLMTDDKMSGMGFEGILKYNGIPFIVDSHMKAGSFYFVNENHFKMYVHKDEDMRVQSFDQLENQNGIKRRVLLMANFLCDARRQLAELADIAVAS